MERKPLTTDDLRSALDSLTPAVRGVLVDKVDGMDENFMQANYVKVVEFGGVAYLAVGRTMAPAIDSLDKSKIHA